MTELGIIRYAPHALVATVVFEFMHIGDEFAGNWAPFTPILEPTVASISLGIFTLWAVAGLWLVLTENPWGYVLTGSFGLFFFIVEMWHLFDPANMTMFRWAVVWLAQLSGLICFLISMKALLTFRPWQG